MSFTELYVTPTGHANNGGSGTGGAKETETLLGNIDAVQISGVTHTLANKNNTGWGTTTVGDWLCFDTASAQKLCVVTALSVGGDINIIEVKSLTGTGSIAGTGKGVRVGGAWQLPSRGFARMSTIGAINWTAAGLTFPPRLNIKTANANGSENVDYIETASLNSTALWGSVVFTIAGYRSSPGDINPWIDNDRAVIDFGNNSYNVFFTVSGHTHVMQNIFIKSSGMNGYLIYNGGGTIGRVVLINVKFEQLHPHYNSFGVDLATAGVCIRCHGTVSDNINNFCFSRTVAINCFAKGMGKTQSIGFQNSTVINSIATNCLVGIDEGSAAGCSVYNCTNGTRNIIYAINNKIELCTNAFSAYTAQKTHAINYNELFGNITNFNNYTIPFDNNIIAIASLFQNAAADDFRPSATSPGLGAGFGKFPFTSNADSYPDTGAFQKQAGGVSLIGPGGLVY